MRPFALLLLLAAVTTAENDPQQWVWFDCRDSEDGPRLVLRSPDGKTRTISATEDTVVISYLSDRPWGNLPRLSVSLGDTNRILLRFDVPAGDVAAAELVLKMDYDPRARPAEPFDLGVYGVREAWSEPATTWENQPAIDDTPLASASVKPEKGEVRLDVTDAVRKGLPHGIALRVTRPIGPPPEVRKAAPPPARDQAAPGSFLLEGLPWASDVAKAKEQAAEGKKLVLALVRGAFGGEELVLAEELLLATALQHPEVSALVAKRFVPVRVACLPYLHTFAIEKEAPDDPRDPLPALGTRVQDAKPPALVVATPDGKHVATLASIGTYDYGIVQRFLLRAAEEPARAPSEGVARMRAGELGAAEKLLAGDDGESRYWKGALLWRRGERDAAIALWRAIAPGTPWHRKAKARLSWPARLDMFECLAQPADVLGTTEVMGGAGAVKRALAYLVSQQRADGSWTSAQDYAPIDGAITALCARALLAYGGDAEALKRATTWLRAYVEKTDPAEANAWSACYALDFFCDLGHKEDAQKAVRFVEGGQGPTGAWSYGRSWGIGWKGGFGGWPVTDKGRYHSMNTGPSLLSLLRARDLGLKVDAAVLEKGKEALLAMRERAGVYTYTWPEPRNFHQEPRFSIGRGPVCEHALFRLDGASKEDLVATLATFLEWKGGLRGTVKLTGAWTPPSCTSAYFYFFAYHHAAEALDALGDAKSREMLRADVLGCVEADGTWIDYEPNGKPYATAMALLILK